jgi:hypothetical protein
LETRLSAFTDSLIDKLNTYQNEFKEAFEELKEVERASNEGLKELVANEIAAYKEESDKEL